MFSSHLMIIPSYEGTTQARRRVFKSGPAEEAIECRRHERGGLFPLWLGGMGASPRKNLNFERFYVRFNGFLCVWDQILVVLVTKIFLVA